MEAFLVGIRRLAEPVRVGVSVATAAVAALAAVFGLGASLGIGGLVGIAALCLALYGIGAILQASELAERRQAYRDQAFLWHGSARDANPIRHFTVRPWHGRLAGESQTAIPPFAWRTVATDLAAGLRYQRFVILKGDRPSGKSRLLREVLLTYSAGIIFITERAPVSAKVDPFIELMREDDSFMSHNEPAVIVMRDCVTRLISGALTADFLARWLSVTRRRQSSPR